MISKQVDSPKNMTLVSHGEAGKFPLYIRREQQGSTLWHEHEFVELVMILEGSAEHCVKNARSPGENLRRGDIFLVPRGVVHRYINCCDLELLNILYIPEQLTMPLLDAGAMAGFDTFYKGGSKNDEVLPFLHLEENNFAALETLALELYEENFQRRIGFQFNMLGKFMSLLGKLARFYASERYSNDKNCRDITDVVAYLHSRFRQKITLEQLCRVARMSRSSLMRNFQEVIGMPPMRYQLQLRISEAIQLLRMTGKSLGDIAFELGFYDSNYFCRQFKKITGYSPREYREMLWRESAKNIK